MIFIWILLYGGIYLLAERISDKIGQMHWITAVAILLYAVALILWSGRTSQKRFRITYAVREKPRTLFYCTPLLLFPLTNLLVLRGEWQGYALLLTIGTCIVEEIFFRGYLFSLFPEKKWTGSILCSGAFSLLHLVNLANAAPDFVCMQVLSAFAVGLCFCGLTLRFKSLLPSTLLHVAINLSGVGRAPSSTLWWHTCILLCSMVYAVYGWYFIHNENRKQENIK